MPEVTAHAPGSFCWFELNTSDPAAAKTFYKGLFGWQGEDMPAGPDMVYTMLRLRGFGGRSALRFAAGAKGARHTTSLDDLYRGRERGCRCRKSSLSWRDSIGGCF
jgi:predicted enzyme related to lactoylglutathione lyase